MNPDKELKHSFSPNLLGLACIGDRPKQTALEVLENSHLPTVAVLFNILAARGIAVIELEDVRLS